MKNDKLFQQLKEKMILVSSIPTQNIGPFTPYWKKVVPHVKTSPFKTLALGGFTSSFILWLLLGGALVRLVSILQYGF